MKIIKYIPKITSARTQYVDLDQNDMGWLQSELIRYLSVMGELDGNRHEDVRQIMRFWWYKRTSLLPKGQNGQNSPLTFIAGLVNNLVYGTQNNLSTPTMDGIEYVSSQIHNLEVAMYDIDNNIKIGQPVKFVLGISPFVIPK